MWAAENKPELEEACKWWKSSANWMKKTAGEKNFSKIWVDLQERMQQVVQLMPRRNLVSCILVIIEFVLLKNSGRMGNYLKHQINMTLTS